MQALALRGPAFALVTATSIAAFVASACGGAPPRVEPTAGGPQGSASSAPVASTAAPVAHFDPCAASPPVWRKYDGILKRAKCDQDMFLTMAGVADALDVKCEACHVPNPSGKGFDYPKMTEMKKKALWMDHYFIENLRQRDGQPMRCKSCHVDKSGKPSLHFLGTPRDVPYAIEWMSTVMTSKFTQKDGTDLKCKNCHGGGWGSKEFSKKLILTSLPFTAPPPAELFAEPPPHEAASSAPISSAPAASSPAAASASAPPPAP
jgi:hypothetical protein